MTSRNQAFRGSFLHCTDNPAVAGAEAVHFIEDGMLVIEDGHVVALTNAVQANMPANTPVHDYRGKWIVPGFVDCHVHYPQVDVMACHGTQLLDWLNNYTFPAEQAFSDQAIATETAAFFLEQLLANGTTTALVFGTVHKASVNAFFAEAKQRKLRMICGKVMMDRNAPEGLCDTPLSSYEDSKALINQWHGQDRLGYAVTPRFAPTSSGEQLALAGQLLDEHPNVHLHTHLSENPDECEWVKTLFPDQSDYLGVYEQHGLVRKRSMFAHAIHLSTSEWSRLNHANASVAHCPCSNLFIGSGLFDWRAASSVNVPVGFGTDVGGGDSMSLLRAANEAYKIQQLQNVSLDPLTLFYTATLGGAVALDLDKHIGNFETGKEADFIVLEPDATPLLARRMRASNDWQSSLFALTMLGDDRCIHDTFILGESSKRSTTTR